jgi:class 3 adenylate cyclase
MDDNDLVLSTTALSRHHALLAAVPSGYALTDLHSSNGTYVNRELVKRPTLLNDGDEIQIGDVALRYRCTRMQAPEDHPDGNPQATRIMHDVRARLCWLLVTDIVGYSTLTQQIGNETALGHLRTWLTGIRPLLENNGACIQDYIGDAIFAYWPCDTAGPSQVLKSLQVLEAYRRTSPLPYRLVVHHGSCLFTKGDQGAQVSGQDVNFVFRAEKVAKQFRTLAMLSLSAVQTLRLDDRCVPLGESTVDGMSGSFAFFGLPSDLSPPTTSR